MSNAVLKSVAVTAFASQTLANDTYEGLVKWVVDEAAQGRGHTQIVKQIKEVEAEMKRLYNTTSMPSAWRSAKSVVLSAVGAGVALMEGGKTIGKSDLEHRITVTRTIIGAGATTNTTSVTKYVRHITKAHAL